MQQLRHNLFISLLSGLVVMGIFLIIPHRPSIPAILVGGLYAAWLVLDIKAFNDILRAYDRRDLQIPTEVERIYLVERLCLTILNFGIFVGFLQRFLASNQTGADCCLMALATMLFVVFPILLWLSYFVLRYYTRKSTKSQQITEVTPHDCKIITLSEDEIRKD